MALKSEWIASVVLLLVWGAIAGMTGVAALRRRDWGLFWPVAVATVLIGVGWVIPGWVGSVVVMAALPAMVVCVVVDRRRRAAREGTEPGAGPIC